MRTESKNAALYMAEHRWLKDGVAWEQVAAVIDRERDDAEAREQEAREQQGMRDTMLRG